MMIELKKAQEVYERAKILRDATKKFYKLREREDEIMARGFHNTTKKQRDKIRVDCDWQANHVRDMQHQLHISVVEAGIAPAYADSYYDEEATVCPTGFHEYKQPRKKPRLA